MCVDTLHKGDNDDDDDDDNNNNNANILEGIRAAFSYFCPTFRDFGRDMIRKNEIYCIVFVPSGHHVCWIP
jgi:hypothetical protein